MEIQIVPAKEEDATKISDLVNRCYRGEEALQGWTTDAGDITGNRTNTTTVRQEIKQSGLTYLECVDVSTEEIVGCVYLKIGDDGKEAHVGSLSVLPKMQSRGIGRLLMDEMEEIVKEKGCTFISMQVTSIRDSLIAWYKRRGFQDTGLRQPFPPKGRYGVTKFPLEFTWMEKRL